MTFGSGLVVAVRMQETLKRRGSDTAPPGDQNQPQAALEVPSELGATVPKLDPLPRVRDAGPM